MVQQLDLEGDLYFCLGSFVAIFLLDQVLKWAHWFHEKKDNTTRYFSLHIIVNAYVVYEYLPDVIAVYLNPNDAFLGPCNTRGTLAIYALHIYHIVFYRPLDMVDWVHHLVMCVVMLPLGYFMAPGRMLAHGAFYASGLPGGLDYVMLVMIKLGWLSKMSEKKYNVYIQLWCRAPGCVIHAFLTWHNYLEAVRRFGPDIDLSRLPENATMPLLPRALMEPAALIVFASFFWNGLYFLERVIRSHERHLTKNEIKEKEKGGERSQTHKEVAAASFSSPSGQATAVSYSETTTSSRVTRSRTKLTASTD